MTTVSAPTVGTLQPIPDAATALPPDSGAPAHANFRNVLEQVRASRESDTKADDPKSSRDRRPRRDADPAATQAAPQAVTPPTEAPRSILPFTTSFTLRQDATPSDDAAPQDTSASADDTARIQNSTTALADPPAVPSATATAPTAFPAPLILRALDVPSLPQASNPKTNSASKTNTAPSGARQKLLAKLQAKSQELLSSKPVATPPASTVQADPPAPVLPIASSTTLDQAATAVKASSTVTEAPDAATTSTSTVDRGAFILADSRVDSRKAAYQFHSSQEAKPATVTPGKIADSTATITVPVTVTETVEPQRVIHTLAPSNTSRQDAPAAQNNSAAAQDSLTTASATDSKTAMPSAIVQADDTTATPPAGSLAFAARLTPTEETPAPTSTATPDANRPADSQSRAQTALQSATAATSRQMASESELPSDAHSGESGSQSDKENRFAKPEMVVPQTHPTLQDQSTAAAPNHASASLLSPAARMDQVQEPPATAPSGNRDITIRIPDSNTDQGTAVRFVERAGEVHVTVRTGDAEMAQTLRGGLNDLVNRLEDGGIRTQVWQPGTDSSTSQNDSHHPFADPDGSNGRQFSSGSNSEPESKQQNKPRWVEELEGSIGNPNFKETTQLLWQA